MVSMAVPGWERQGGALRLLPQYPLGPPGQAVPLPSSLTRRNGRLWAGRCSPMGQSLSGPNAAVSIWHSFSSLRSWKGNANLPKLPSFPGNHH